MTTPMAVVFQKADGGVHEMWVPPGFAVVMTNGGILVTHEEHMVTTLLSVRPVRGEGDADQVHEHGEGAEDRVGERGREPDSVVLGSEAGVGSGPGEGSAEGSGVPGDTDGRCPGHTVEFNDGPRTAYCSAGLGCNDTDACDLCDEADDGFCALHPAPWRTPGPDDAPGVTV